MSTQNFMSSRLDQAARTEIIKDGAFTYIGMAPLGSLSNQNVWSIQRVEVLSTGISITWADGSPIFNKNLTTYASYSYS